MQGEAAAQLRAWVEYYRDLGVYDLYRRGEGISPAESELTPAPMVLSEVYAEETPTEVEPVAASSERTVTPPQAASSSPPLSDSSSVPPAIKLVSFDNLAPLPAGSIAAADRPDALKAIQRTLETALVVRSPMPAGTRLSSAMVRPAHG
jgi:hypothetical protein